MVFEAVKIALDPAPAQERLLLSHAGGARFAYNAGLAHVKAALDAGEKPERSFYSLRKWWNANKDTIAVGEDGVIWWAENSKEAYSYGLESLARGLSNWSKSRRGGQIGRATRVAVKCEPSGGANRVRLGAGGRKGALQATVE